MSGKEFVERKLSELAKLSIPPEIQRELDKYEIRFPIGKPALDLFEADIAKSPDILLETTLGLMKDYDREFESRLDEVVMQISNKYQSLTKTGIVYAWNVLYRHFRQCKVPMFTVGLSNLEKSVEYWDEFGGMETISDNWFKLGEEEPDLFKTLNRLGNKMPGKNEFRAGVCFIYDLIRYNHFQKTEEMKAKLLQEHRDEQLLELLGDVNLGD